MPHLVFYRIHAENQKYEDVLPIDASLNNIPNETEQLLNGLFGFNSLLVSGYKI